MIVPGIFEENQESALEKLRLLGDVAEKIQLDIADGLLVDGKTFQDLSFLSGLNISAGVQLHLMVQKPESFLMSLPACVKDVCVQAEALLYKPMCMESFDDVLKSKRIRVGISFNPQTSFTELIDCIHQCDYVQLMAVNPGGQSRPFIMKTLDRIQDFKKEFPDCPLQIDGGINTDTLSMVVEAGADDVTIGSAIFRSADPVQTYQNFVLQFASAHRNFHNSQ